MATLNIYIKKAGQAVCLYAKCCTRWLSLQTVVYCVSRSQPLKCKLNMATLKIIGNPENYFYAWITQSNQFQQEVLMPEFQKAKNKKWQP